MDTITFRPPNDLASELELLVRRGRFGSITEAMIEAVRLLIQRERTAQALAHVAALREKTRQWPADLTAAVVAGHEEED